MAFYARSRILEKNGKNLDNAYEILEYCDKGGALLKESLAFSSLHRQSDLLEVFYELYVYYICQMYYKHMKSCSVLQKKTPSTSALCYDFRM